MVCELCPNKAVIYLFIFTLQTLIKDLDLWCLVGEGCQDDSRASGLHHQIERGSPGGGLRERGRGWESEGSLGLPRGWP